MHSPVRDRPLLYHRSGQRANEATQRTPVRISQSNWGNKAIGSSPALHKPRSLLTLGANIDEARKLRYNPKVR